MNNITDHVDDVESNDDGKTSDEMTSSTGQTRKKSKRQNKKLKLEADA